VTFSAISIEKLIEHVIFNY